MPADGIDVQQPQEVHRSSKCKKMLISIYINRKVHHFHFVFDELDLSLRNYRAINIVQLTHEDRQALILQ